MGDSLKLIRKQVAKGLRAAGLTRPAILIRTTEGAYTAGQESGDTTKTTTSYKCRGIVSDYTDDEIDGTLIKKGDRRIVLIGQTLGAVVPTPLDKITIEGGTYTIASSGVQRDAAAATFTCQCRG